MRISPKLILRGSLFGYSLVFPSEHPDQHHVEEFRRGLVEIKRYSNPPIKSVLGRDRNPTGQIYWVSFNANSDLETIHILPKLVGVEDLFITERNDIQIEHLKLLQRVDSLSVLFIDKSSLTRQHLSAISQLTQLDGLVIVGGGLTDESLPELGKLSHLNW